MKNLLGLKRALACALFVTTFSLSGCIADGSGAGTDPREDPTPTEPPCAVPVGTMCIIGNTENGLVDDLLDENGVLHPISDHIAPSRDVLIEALKELLENNGDLGSLLENLLAGDNIPLATAVLLDGGLQTILEDLLDPATIAGLLGPQGLTGIVTGLLVNSGGSTCQAAVSTICLVAGPNSNQVGLLDALLTSDGLLADLAENLGQDDLVGTLANMLQSDGTLLGLVDGLLIQGNLIKGLQTLLDPTKQGSLADALGDLLLGQNRDSDLITQLLTGLGALLFPQPAP